MSRRRQLSREDLCGREPRRVESRCRSSWRQGVCRYVYFFFQAEDGIRDLTVTGVQTCALPILKGWFKPQMAAQINQRDDGYFLGPGDKVPSVNGRPIAGPTRLNDGDVIEVSRSEERRVGKECRSRWSPDH